MSRKLVSIVVWRGNRVVVWVGCWTYLRCNAKRHFSRWNFDHFSWCVYISGFTCFSKGPCKRKSREDQVLKFKHFLLGKFRYQFIFRRVSSEALDFPVVTACPLYCYELKTCNTTVGVASLNEQFDALLIPDKYGNLCVFNMLQFSVFECFYPYFFTFSGATITLTAPISIKLLTQRSYLEYLALPIHVSESLHWVLFNQA